MDMRVRKVTASIGLRMRTSQYETAHIELGAEADIGDDQGVSVEESERYHNYLCAQLRERVAKPQKSTCREMEKIFTHRTGAQTTPSPSLQLVTMAY